MRVPLLIAVSALLVAACDREYREYRSNPVTTQTEEKLALVRELCTPDLTLVAAHGIMWYLRNSLFFDLQLHERHDALLVRYEDLVKQPLTYFPELFEFAGVGFDRQFVAGIYDRSIGRDAAPELPARIEQLCAGVHARELEFYRSRQREALLA